VGDLSPEASFLEGAQNNTKTSRHARVGVWLDQESDPRTDNHDTSERSPFDTPSTTERFGLASLQSLKPYLKSACANVLPPDYEYGVLSNLFHSKIATIFPIVTVDDLRNTSGMEATVLKQCMCLVASLDPAMQNFLRLPHTDRTLSQLEFRECLSMAVKQSLDMGFINDKVIIFQACTLMAFSVDKPGCSDISSYYCALAVHHSQTLGLHLGWPDEGTRSEKSQRLFWCIWALDRLNAATNGRPVLMHSRDMDGTMPSSAKDQPAPFRLMIKITELLDSVIGQYRPVRNPPPDSVTPDTDQSFEDLAQEAGATDIGDSLFGMLNSKFSSNDTFCSRRAEINRSTPTNAHFSNS
jgi:hypothetical protein